jgi:hypothetical protein
MMLCSSGKAGSGTSRASCSGRNGMLSSIRLAKTGVSAVRAVAQDLKPRIGGSQGKRYAQARKIIAALKETNQPIAEAFHSGAGLHLMFHEALLLQQNMALMRILRAGLLISRGHPEIKYGSRLHASPAMA